MRLPAFFLIVACSNVEGPALSDPDTAADADTDTDSDTDTDADTDTDTDTDTGPTAEDAVGTCLAEAELGTATAVTLTTLYEGPITWTSSGRAAIPAVNVVSEAGAWDTFRAETGLALPDVDFTAHRVAILTDWQASTCGSGLIGVEGWAMPDGTTTYVEARMRTSGTNACDTGCSMEDSVVVVVQVPSSGGVVGCRRTETWCG